MNNDDSVSLLAETKRKRFGVRQEDRRHHMYVIGKTGTGKSTLLATLLRQNLEQGRGVALVDPHGDLVHEILLSPMKTKLDHRGYLIGDVRPPESAYEASLIRG